MCVSVYTKLSYLIKFQCNQSILILFLLNTFVTQPKYYGIRLIEGLVCRKHTCFHHLPLSGQKSCLCRIIISVNLPKKLSPVTFRTQFRPDIANISFHYLFSLHSSQNLPFLRNGLVGARDWRCGCWINARNVNMN